jgi:hypothetical protein
MRTKDMKQWIIKIAAILIVLVMVLAAFVALFY